MNLQQKSPSFGHLLASITILIWGTTFVSTKVLLEDFTPTEILIIRFLIGYGALLLFYPKKMVIRERKHRLYFLGAGASGITVYYLLENIALTMTTASNVGIIVTMTPFFTALLSGWFLKAEKPGIRFYLGFLLALTGVAFISYNGSNLELNPMGDALAMLAAALWAVYSVLVRKISAFDYHPIQSTRSIFFYGIVLMLPLFFVSDFSPMAADILKPVNLGNILFLGLGASALCFVTWNSAVGILGAVKTSVYIYLVPVVTVTASVIILGEPLTPLLLAGIALTLTGLWLSETKAFQKLKAAKAA